MLRNEIPSGWNHAPLHHLTDRIIVGLAMGVTQYYCDEGTCLIRNQNIRPNRFDDSETLCVTESFAATQKNKRLRPNDVITVRTGSKIGSTCVVPAKYVAALTFTTLITSPSPDILSSQFLSYYVNSHLGRAEVHRLMAGGGKGNLNSSELKKFRLLVPPLSEQTHISVILSAWDRAIELTERLIAAKQNRKRALMQQLLTGKVRFAEFDCEPWREVRLGDVFTERREPNYIDMPLLSITANNGVVHRDTLDRKDNSNADKSKYLRICPGDIGYNTMRMWQGVSALSGHEGIVSPAYTICTPSSDVDSVFMSYLFKFPPMVHLFRRYSQGMVDDTLNLKFSSFARIKARVPPQEEQAKIGAVFAAIDEEIKCFKCRAAGLSNQKDGLMQQLLTGKIRVSPLERQRT